MLADWIAVERNIYITHDLEAYPLLIKTDSELGSNHKTKVLFFTENLIAAGGVSIEFSTNPKFFLHSCKSSTVFPTSLPEATTKEWKITLIKRAPENLIRVLIHCNDKEVLSYDMSSSCTTSGWTTWKNDIEKINFKNEDTASDFYAFLKVEPLSPVIHCTKHDIIKITDWETVERGVRVNFNLENIPLEIKTDSLVGSGDVVGLYFFKDQNTPSGAIVLDFRSPPLFNLNGCTSRRRQFQAALPSESFKVWKITLSRDSGIRDVMIHCNDVEVVKLSLSNEVCGENAWSTQ
ncbi:hypothetical protein ACHWQZ_G000266 [Mnemiopsis leidyi]